MRRRWAASPPRKSAALSAIARRWSTSPKHGGTRCWRRSRNASSNPAAGGAPEAFVEHLDASIAIYEKLVALTDRTYVNPTDMVMWLNWHNGLVQFKADRTRQRIFLMLLENRLPKGLVWVEAAGMEGDWKWSIRRPGYLGDGFCMSPPGKKPSPLRKAVAIHQAARYTVWVHGYLSHPARAFAVEVAGKRFPPTHQEGGTSGEGFVWRKAGELDLKAGPVEVAVHHVGPDRAYADVIVLVDDPAWTPPE